MAKGLELGYGVAGVELAYAEVTANQASITTEVDVTGLSITVTFRSRPVMLWAFCALLANDTVNKAGQLWLREGATGLALANTVPTPVAGQGQSLTVHKRIAAQTPGAQKTYKLTVQAPSIGGTRGTATFHANALYPAFIQAVEI